MRGSSNPVVKNNQRVDCAVDIGIAHENAADPTQNNQALLGCYCEAGIKQKKRKVLFGSQTSGIRWQANLTKKTFTTSSQTKKASSAKGDCPSQKGSPALFGMVEILQKFPPGGLKSSI